MIGAGDCAAIVLAAGRSARFGDADKLLTPLAGRPLVDHILTTVRAIGFQRRIAVVANPDVAELTRSRGFRVALAEPDALQGDNVRKGAMAVGESTFVMIFLGDMPFIPRGHVDALLAQARPGQVIATCSRTYLGPPVVLPTDLARSVPIGVDKGARHFLQGAITVETDEHSVADVDVPADLERLVWRRLP